MFVLMEHNILKRCYPDNAINRIPLDTLKNEYGIYSILKCRSQDEREKAIIYLDQNGVCDNLIPWDVISLTGKMLTMPSVQGSYRESLFDRLDRLFDQYSNEDPITPDKKLCLKEIYDIMVNQYPERSYRMVSIINSLDQEDNGEVIHLREEMIRRETLQEQALRNAPPLHLPPYSRLHVNLQNKFKSIANDSQNVHTTSINTSSNYAIKYLVRLTTPVVSINDVDFYVPDGTVEEFHQKIRDEFGENWMFFPSNMFKRYSTAIYVNHDQKDDLEIPKLSNTIDKHAIVNDILNNKLNINWDNVSDILPRRLVNDRIKDITFFEILTAIIKFAKGDENIHKRLREELIDGSHECTTGLATRMVNSIQGFFSEEEHPLLSLKISNVDRLKLKLPSVIEGISRSYNIDVICDRDIFKEKVLDHVDKNANIYLTEYGFTKEKITDFLLEVCCLK